MTHAKTELPAERTAAIDYNGNGTPEAVHDVEDKRHFEMLPFVRRHAPTLLVACVLAGLGIYGHRSGWRLPRFSALVGTASNVQDDWCEEHGVSESQCVECHPKLLRQEKNYGWCKEHGVHDCPLDHPDIAQLKQPPTVTEEDRRQAKHALALLPRDENNPVCKNYLRHIQFGSVEAVKKAGVDVGLVERQPISDCVAANGQIAYDQTRFASLSSRTPGTVWRVEKNVGDHVQAGDLLALVDAADVGRAKTELLQSLAQEELQKRVVDRLDTLSSQGIVSGRQSQTAETELVQAQARLLSADQTLMNLGFAVNLDELRGLPAEERMASLRRLGVPEEHRRNSRPDEVTANLLPVKTPFAGVVVTRQAVAGEAVEPSRVLFQIADTGRMWLTLNISVEDAGRIAMGQPVRFRPDGGRDEMSGKIVWISTTADAQMRTVAVRAELPNPGNQLRNETFGVGKIVLRETPEAVTVPNEAVHSEGCCHVVFVRDKDFFAAQDSPKVFHVRTVRPGAKNDKCTEIIAGLLPGEVVATNGSDVLRAKLLQNNLGEGCCAGK
jgi:membrane fusion protein, heavy metal efflux system